MRAGVLRGGHHDFRITVKTIEQVFRRKDAYQIILVAEEGLEPPTYGL
jgi:hypothetical protein